MVPEEVVFFVADFNWATSVLESHDFVSDRVHNLIASYKSKQIQPVSPLGPK
jgi:hypothetical protein